MASRLGVRKLILECDSNRVIDLLRNNIRDKGNLHNLIRRCQLEADGFEDVIFLHVFREQSRLADALAKSALRQSTGSCQFTEAPSDLMDILYEDRLGATFKRRIPRYRRVNVD